MSTPALDTRAARPVGAVQQITGALKHLVRTPELRGLLACNLVLGMAVSFVVPFLSLFCTTAVGMSLHGFGLFMTANAVVNIAIGTWLAKRSDSRYSRRTLLLLASACGAFGYVGYALVRDPWLLFLLGGFVLGVASVTFSQLFACARELVERSPVPKSDVPLYMNAFRMAFALAWTVGPAVAALTLEHASFEGLFGAAASLFALLFLGIWAFVRGVRPMLPAPNGEAPKPERSVWRQRGVIAWFAALTLMLAAHAISMNNMSLLVLHVLGGTQAQIGVIFSLAPIFELPAMLYIGALATRMPSERLMRGAMLLAFVYYIGLACVRSAQQIYPLQLLSALFVSVTSGVAITFFQNKLPKQLGTATNLYSNAARVGQTSGYLTFGVVASRFGHRGTAVACAVLAAAALLLTALPGSRQPEGLET